MGRALAANKKIKETLSALRGAQSGQEDGRVGQKANECVSKVPELPLILHYPGSKQEFVAWRALFEVTHTQHGQRRRMNTKDWEGCRTSISA